MERTLNTRIILKNDTLAEWSKDTSLILNKGEIALVSIETVQPGGSGYSVPTYLMKVGDGRTAFSGLNWLAAPASDVYAWAKQENPEVKDLPSNLKNAILEIQAKLGLGGGEDDPDGGAVAEMIADAITAAVTALKNEDAAVDNQFVTAAVQENGKVTVTRRELTAADIPELGIDKITGLAEAIADAKKAGTDAADALGTFKTEIEADLATETRERQAADEAINARIDTLSNAMHFIGAGNTLPAEMKDGEPTHENGDVYVVTTTGKEYVYVITVTEEPDDETGEPITTSVGRWEELGDVTAEGNRLTQLETSVNGIEGQPGLLTRVSSLEANSATAAALEQLNQTVISNENDIENKLTALTEGAVKTATDNIAILNGGVETTGSVAKAIKDAIDNEKISTTYATKNELGSVSGEVAQIKEKYVSSEDFLILDCGGATQRPNEPLVVVPTT